MTLKTCKALKKRIKIKKNFFLRKKAGKSHLLRKKNSKKLRFLSTKEKINSSYMFTFRKMLPYK